MSLSCYELLEFGFNFSQYLRMLNSIQCKPKFIYQPLVRICIAEPDFVTKLKRGQGHINVEKQIWFRCKVIFFKKLFLHLILGKRVRKIYVKLYL